MFFVIGCPVWADDEQLRKAFDQLNASYVDTQKKMRDREVALRTLTESLAIARTESELFEKLWTEAQVQAQTLGANLTESDATGTHRQLVETLRRLYLAEADRQRLTELLQRLVSGVESNRDVSGEMIAAKKLLTEKPVTTAVPVSSSSLTAARILEVHPKLRLVVLDVGSQQGARIGMPMMVIHGDRVVGEIRIVEVRQRICGALIENVENNVTVQAGDTARVTKS